MKIFQRVIFIIVLVVFVGASVWLTFNTVSRDTFEYTEKQDIAGLGFDGWVFDGFNGNSNTSTVTIDYVTDKHGDNKDMSKPIVAVDDYTFVSDEYVQYIYIGKSVRYIDEQAFVYCKLLRAIYVDDENPWYTDVDGVLYSKDMKKIILYPICRCTQIVIDDIKAYGEVKNIGMELKETLSVNGKNDEELFADFKQQVSDDVSREMFDEMKKDGAMAPYIGTYYIIKEKTDTSLSVEKYWSKDEKFSIPEGIERVSNYCFYKCDRLMELTIPSSVTTIGDMAFFKCTNMALVTLPEGLTEIGNDAFSYCWNMKYAIYIPKSVKTIGHHCFYKCDALSRFYLEASSESEISLGGAWQPKAENSFSAEPPFYAATKAEFEAYLAERRAQEKPAPIINKDETNFTIIILFIIFIFVPCLIIVIIQVIRNMLKPDFLMTKKRKLKEKQKTEELERLKAEYEQSLVEGMKHGEE